MMELTTKEKAAFDAFCEDLGINPLFVAPTSWSKTMDIFYAYHPRRVEIQVRRCDSWTWIEAFENHKTTKSVKVEK